MIRVARGESWIIDLTKRGDGLRRCAAPIVTELLVEIVKLLPTPALHERDPMVEMSMLSNGKCSAWGYLGSTCYADTLPNALSDLWMEMAGKEKEKEP